MEILWEFYCNHCQQPDHSEDAFGQLPCPIVKTFVLVISLNIRSYFLWISGHDFFEYHITISLNIRSWFLCNEILDHRSLGAPLVRSMQLSSSYALWSKLYFCPTDVFEYNFMSFVYHVVNIRSWFIWISDHDFLEYQSPHCQNFLCPGWVFEYEIKMQKRKF